MRAAVRSPLAIAAGLVAGNLLIFAIETLSRQFYPLPPDIDSSDMQALATHSGTLPAGAFLWTIAAWAAGTFAGAWIAARLAGRRALPHALIAGALFLALGVVNMLMLPHPAWVWIAGVLVFALASYAGGRLASDDTRASAP